MTPARQRGSVVTIGAYDGVHLGHRKVLALVRELADARGLDAALVTFDRHPASVVRPESAPRILTSLPHKLDLLDALGLLDEIVVIEFDEARSRETAEDFVHHVLVDQLRAKVVVVGEDFHFGHKRGGNVALLSRMGTDLDFEVVGLNLIAPEGDPDHEPYSSTRIRALLADGDVGQAARLLGRAHAVRGTVVHGDNRGGSELGFPTANVVVAPETSMPANGIYAGHLVDAEGVVRAAAISLGTRPTFHPDAHESVLEVFVLDFDGDLYDTQVEVRFVERLRGEERFDSVEALVEQMHRDVAETRRLLVERHAMNIEEFYDADPRRRASDEVELGRDWHDAEGIRYEVSWVADTGELYLMREPVEPIDTEPAFGTQVLEPMDMDTMTVEVIATVATRKDLEAILTGWEDRMAAADSLAWVRERLA